MKKTEGRKSRATFPLRKLGNNLGDGVMTQCENDVVLCDLCVGHCAGPVPWCEAAQPGEDPPAQHAQGQGKHTPCPAHGLAARQDDTGS
jgi:hypothetical protein